MVVAPQNLQSNLVLLRNKVIKFKTTSSASAENSFIRFFFIERLGRVSFEMILFVAAFVVLLSVVAIYWINFARRDELLSKISSPRKHFLLHNAMEFLGVSLEDVFKKIERWHEEIGEVFHVTLHPFDCGMIVVANPRIAEAISIHQPDRHRSRFYEAIARWIGATGYFLSREKQLKSQIKPMMMATNPKFNERVRHKLTSSKFSINQVL